MTIQVGNFNKVSHKASKASGQVSFNGNEDHKKKKKIVTKTYVKKDKDNSLSALLLLLLFIGGGFFFRKQLKEGLKPLLEQLGLIKKAAAKTEGALEHASSTSHFGGDSFGGGGGGGWSGGGGPTPPIIPPGGGPPTPPIPPNPPIPPGRAGWGPTVNPSTPNEVISRLKRVIVHDSVPPSPARERIQARERAGVAEWIESLFNEHSDIDAFQHEQLLRATDDIVQPRMTQRERRRKQRELDLVWGTEPIQRAKRAVYNFVDEHMPRIFRRSDAASVNQLSASRDEQLLAETIRNRAVPSRVQEPPSPIPVLQVEAQGDTIFETLDGRVLSVPDGGKSEMTELITQAQVERTKALLDIRDRNIPSSHSSSEEIEAEAKAIYGGLYAKDFILANKHLFIGNTEESILRGLDSGTLKIKGDLIVDDANRQIARVARKNNGPLEIKQLFIGKPEENILYGLESGTLRIEGDLIVDNANRQFARIARQEDGLPFALEIENKVFHFDPIEGNLTRFVETDPNNPAAIQVTNYQSNSKLGEYSGYGNDGRLGLRAEYDADGHIIFRHNDLVEEAELGYKHISNINTNRIVNSDNGRSVEDLDPKILKNRTMMQTPEGTQQFEGIVERNFKTDQYSGQGTLEETKLERQLGNGQFARIETPRNHKEILNKEQMATLHGALGKNAEHREELVDLHREDKLQQLRNAVLNLGAKASVDGKIVIPPAQIAAEQEIINNQLNGILQIAPIKADPKTLHFVAETRNNLRSLLSSLESDPMLFKGSPEGVIQTLEGANVQIIGSGNSRVIVHNNTPIGFAHLQNDKISSITIDPLNISAEYSLGTHNFLNTLKAPSSTLPEGWSIRTSYSPTSNQFSIGTEIFNGKQVVEERNSVGALKYRRAFENGTENRAQTYYNVKGSNIPTSYEEYYNGFSSSGLKIKLKEDGSLDSGCRIIDRKEEPLTQAQWMALKPEVEPRFISADVPITEACVAKPGVINPVKISEILEQVKLKEAAEAPTLNLFERDVNLIPEGPNILDAWKRGEYSLVDVPGDIQYKNLVGVNGTEIPVYYYTNGDVASFKIGSTGINYLSGDLHPLADIRTPSSELEGGMVINKFFPHSSTESHYTEIANKHGRLVEGRDHLNSEKSLDYRAGYGPNELDIYHIKTSYIGREPHTHEIHSDIQNHVTVNFIGKDIVSGTATINGVDTPLNADQLAALKPVIHYIEPNAPLSYATIDHGQVINPVFEALAKQQKAAEANRAFEAEIQKSIGCIVDPATGKKYAVTKVIGGMGVTEFKYVDNFTGKIETASISQNQEMFMELKGRFMNELNEIQTNALQSDKQLGGAEQEVFGKPFGAPEDYQGATEIRKFPPSDSQGSQTPGTILEGETPGSAQASSALGHVDPANLANVDDVVVTIEDLQNAARNLVGSGEVSPTRFKEMYTGLGVDTAIIDEELSKISQVLDSQDPVIPTDEIPDFLKKKE